MSTNDKMRKKHLIVESSRSGDATTVHSIGTLGRQRGVPGLCISNTRGATWDASGSNDTLEGTLLAQLRRYFMVIPPIPTETCAFPSSVNVHVKDLMFWNVYLQQVQISF